MQVPFLDLAAQYRDLKEELWPALEKTLAQGRYVLGPEVELFEGELARYVQVAFGVGVNSGSDALTLALRAIGIGPGDEVITTPFTYIAPAESIYQLGARIVFADIDTQTFTLDPAAVERQVTPRTKAIVPVHLFGQAAPMIELSKLAQARGLQLVEDCAQAVGASYHGQAVGSLGKAACFSFYPTKNLGAAGDGGMVVTSDEALAAQLRMLRAHGIQRRYFHEIHGFNSRLDEIQAALLRVKLRSLDRWNVRRRQIAARYTAGLADLPVETPFIAPGNDHVFHVYAILARERDALQAFLAERGVATIIYYPQPLHLQKVYADLGYRAGDFPVSESVSDRILPLPIYPELRDEQVDYVIEVIRQFNFKCTA